MDNDFSDFDLEETYWSLDLSHDLSAWLKEMLKVSVDTDTVYNLLDNVSFAEDVWASIQKCEGGETVVRD